MDPQQDHREDKVAISAVSIGTDTITEHTATVVIEITITRGINGAVHQKICSAKRTLLGKSCYLFYWLERLKPAGFLIS